MRFSGAMTSISLVTGLLGLCGGDEGDDALLGMLEIAGSDLSKPHEIDFFLEFPSEFYARCVMRVMERAGFRIEVTKEKSAWLRWQCQATKTMIPKTNALKRIRLLFTILATLGLGKYDGWQTGPVK